VFYQARRAPTPVDQVRRTARPSINANARLVVRRVTVTRP